MFLPILKLPDPSDIYGANIQESSKPLEVRTQDMEHYLEAASVEHSKDVYDFRWKLGHQVSALLYAFAIRDIVSANKSVNTEELDERVSSYLRATNALFQYTASVNADEYNSDLRTQMSQHNPSFSAHWWKEARKFREVIMPMKQSFPKVKEVVQEFWNLHQKTAEKMQVESSLRQTQGTKRENYALVDPYFDMFFLIQRTKDGERHILSQLEDRLILIEQDLEINGLEEDRYFQNHSPDSLMGVLYNALDSAKESSKMVACPRLEFNHFACQVQNVDETVDWFQKMFGAQETWRMQGGFSDTTLSRLPNIDTLAEIKAGETLWHIFDRKGGVNPLNTPTESAEFQHMCITVACRDDIIKLREKWMELYASNREAYDLIGKPVDILCTDIINEDDGAAGIYFTDPNGLEIEVICPAPRLEPKPEVSNDPEV
ncbi:MAG: VOC family protein [Alphaproteobacteria bacterium]